MKPPTPIKTGHNRAPSMREREGFTWHPPARTRKASRLEQKRAARRAKAERKHEGETS
nr:hypothetical protein [Candidatus Sigynarchaeota archaeon]